MQVVLYAKTVTDITDTYRAIICREDFMTSIILHLSRS